MRGVAAAPQPLGSRREEFDLPPQVAYFNTANLSPLTHRVREAGERALERRARPWTIAAEDWFTDVERLRELFARLIGADAEGVALVPATSYGLAAVARNLALGLGVRILVLAGEYPSGIYTWRAAAAESGAEILAVEREPGQAWTEAILAALDERVAVVSVPNVHWTDGALIDLEAVAERVRSLGCRLVLDVSQSAGAMPLDLARLRPDYLVSVGYKWLLGPFALSYLYVAPEHRDGEPLEQNWIVRAGSEDFARLVDYRDDYQPGARRFDMGQRSSFQLVPMAIAALEQLFEWEVARIAATLAELNATLADRVAAIGLEPVPAPMRGPHLLGVALPAGSRAATPAALAAADCFAAVRGDSLRIAPHLHNTHQEVERLVRALADAAQT
jgi:selenocysteine lyase/cysteine desulfurase